MNSLKKKLWGNNFSHVYVEKNAYSHEIAHRILSFLKKSTIVEVDDYKSFFARSNQIFNVQKNSQKLILAVKKDNLLYEGAKVCQSFDNENFYYTTSVINCVFDCEYCYLQGVYPSANIVIFVNIEDIFDELDKMLENQSIYLCVSYDTDLLGIDFLTNFVNKWYVFSEKHSNLKIELRTKSSNINFFLDKIPNKNFILAWTLSPENFILSYEHKTASLKKRLDSIRKMQDLNYTVRICFDPIMYIDNFYKEYEKLIQETFSNIDKDKILDVSIGTFRISKDYLKKMRKNRADSPLVYYPYECIDGVYSYENKLQREIIAFIKDELEKYMQREKIFL